MPQWSWQWLPGAHLSPQLSNLHKALAFSQACSPQQSLRTTQDKRSSIPRRVEGRQSQKEQAGSMQARVAVQRGSWAAGGGVGTRLMGQTKPPASSTEELCHLRKFMAEGQLLYHGNMREVTAQRGHGSSQKLMQRDAEGLRLWKPGALGSYLSNLSPQPP